MVECDGQCSIKLCEAFGTVSNSSLVVKLMEVWTRWVNYMVGEKLLILELFNILINAPDNGVKLANLQVALSWGERLELLEDGTWAGWRDALAAGMD